jgi:DNA (cytosine-5)-methyltransferase 1
MKLKEKISLEEVCGQTFKIRVVEASEYGKAALTHYLHNPLYPQKNIV